MQICTGFFCVPLLPLPLKAKIDLAFLLLFFSADSEKCPPQDDDSEPEPTLLCAVENRTEESRREERKRVQCDKHVQQTKREYSLWHSFQMENYLAMAANKSNCMPAKCLWW